MNNFRLIHKILTVYKNALWEKGISPETLTPENIGASEAHIRNIHAVLRNAGLIINTNGQTIITLAGLEYLDSNAQMLKIEGEREPYGY